MLSRMRCPVRPVSLAGGGEVFQAQAAVEEAGGGDRADAGDALDPVGRVSGQASPAAPGAGRHPVAGLDLLGADEAVAGAHGGVQDEDLVGDELVHVPVPGHDQDVPPGWHPAHQGRDDVVGLGVHNLDPADPHGVKAALDVGKRLDRGQRGLAAGAVRLVGGVGCAACRAAQLAVEHDDHLGVSGDLVADGDTQEREEAEHAGQVPGLVAAPDAGGETEPGAEQQVAAGLRGMPVSPGAGLGVLAAWAAAAMLAGGLLLRLRDA